MTNTAPESSDSKSDSMNPQVHNSLAKHRAEWKDEQEEIEEQERISGLNADLRVVVYEQKYQMLRHFDTLRWQIPGLVFAVGGALIGFAPKMPNGLPHYIVLGTYGAFTIVGAYVMYRIRYNLRRNTRILRRFAISLGDHGILPDPGIKSASTWMHILLSILGVASLAGSIIGFIYG